MKMRLAVFLALVFVLSILLISSTSAQGDWYYNAKQLVISTGVDSSIIVERSSGAEIDYILANVTFVPKDGVNQDVLSRDINPLAYEESGSYIFRWNYPTQDKLDFSVMTKIRTTNSIKKVSDKVRFPLDDVPSELWPYLQSSDTIDITPEIVSLASGIAEGRDDLYEIVFELAKWTKQNIRYDLSTLTADVSQPSSWVLKTKTGVCDELTNLFISMCRSLGIPGRFISGVAYTDAPEFPENWGAHGWAEVYFPNYGWVPFDPTYGEFGYVDPTHIVLQESVDSEKAATYYEWRGRDFEVHTEALEVVTELESSTGVMAPFISIDAAALYDDAGFGSYNIVEAEIVNDNDFYVATELGLSKSAEVEIVGESYQQILLKPKETKIVLWITQLTSDLDADYIFTFPFTVFSTRNQTDDASFRAKRNDRVYSYETVKSYYDQRLQEGIKTYSASVDFQCSFEKAEYFLNENAEVDCAIVNTGNSFLSDVEVCIADKCEIFDLGISRSNHVFKDLFLDQAGEQSFTATLENDEVSKVNTFEVQVRDKPLIEITDIIAPESVRYDDCFAINFTLKRISLSKPVDVTVVVDRNGHENDWVFDFLDSDKVFEIQMLGSDLIEGENVIEITAVYHDDFHRQYQVQDSFVLELNGLTFVQKVKVFFNRVQSFFENLV